MRFALVALVVACGRPVAESPCLWLVQDGTPTRTALVSRPDGGFPTPAESAALDATPVASQDCLLDAEPDACVTPGFELQHRVACGSTDDMLLAAADLRQGVCEQLLLRCVP